MVYKKIQKINDFIDFANEVGDLVNSEPFVYVHEWGKSIPENTHSPQKLFWVVKALNAQILGLSGRVFPIIDAKYIYWNDKGRDGLYYEGFNGIEIYRCKIDVSEIYVGEIFHSKFEVKDFLDHPSDYAILKIGIDPPRYQLFHLKNRNWVGDIRIDDFKREMDKVWLCWNLYQKYQKRVPQISCPFCGRHMYLDEGFDMVVRRCEKCSKVFVVESSAKELGVEVPKVSSAHNSKRWSNIELWG